MIKHSHIFLNTCCFVVIIHYLFTVLRSNVCSTTLQCLRAVLIESLRPDDIEDLKDIFIEKFVIDIDDNADIIRHPGFVMNHSNKFVSYFVDKFIIGKSSAGSISCLTQFLRETRNRRLQHILSLLEPESNESMGYVGKYVFSSYLYVN